MKVKEFRVGDWVQVQATGIQGYVIEAKPDLGLYRVDCRSYTAEYTVPMLKMITPAEDDR